MKIIQVPVIKKKQLAQLLVYFFTKGLFLTQYSAQSFKRVYAVTLHSLLADNIAEFLYCGVDFFKSIA